MITLGSLFDGIGGFPLGATHNGITPIWASEIESFPIRVTKIRFPNMVHVGDITKLKSDKLPLVDIITGGSPCQDLSVAGARAGLAGERSGLFMEQIRITKEMRSVDERRGKANHLIRPRYFIWENVPGAFSSAKGEDFQAVLEETTRIADSKLSIPRPPRGVWKSVGCILGYEFSIAWRVLDAQYWGVPQRRKRIFLVADFGGHTAPKILFEQESLFGNSKESKVSWKGTTPTTKESINDPVNKRNISLNPTICLNDQGGERMDLTENITSTLRASMGGNLPIVMTTEKSNMENTNISINLDKETSENNKVSLFDNHARDCRYNGPLRVAPTIAATYGTGGNNVPLVSKSIPLDSYCIVGNIIDRQDHNGGNGCGFQENISYTLTTNDIHAVCSSPKTYQDKGVRFNIDGKMIFGQSEFANYKKGFTTIRAGGGDIGGGSENLVSTKNLVRRLTPLECERLQGFPDGWTKIKKSSDSARYKALGNSVAIPCVDYIMRGIAYFLQKSREEGEG